MCAGLIEGPDIVYGTSVLIGNRQRRAVLDDRDARYVPPASQDAEGARVLSERQIVAVVDDEALRMAEADRTILLAQRAWQIAVSAVPD